MSKQKTHGPREIVKAIAATLKGELEKHEPKTYGPRQIVQEIAKTLKQELENYKELSKSVTSEVIDNAANPNGGPVKPTQREVPQLDCELSHADAVEHHAFHAAGRFHEGSEGVAMDHLVLAKAHAVVAGIDHKSTIDMAYNLTEDDLEPISTIFGPTLVNHPLDITLPDELEKARKRVKKGLGPAIGAPAAPPLMQGEREDYPKAWTDNKEKDSGIPKLEATKIAGGEFVDGEHVGKTPDDQGVPKSQGEDHGEGAKVQPAKKGESDAGMSVSDAVRMILSDEYEVDEVLAKVPADKRNDVLNRLREMQKEEMEKKSKDANDFVSREISHLVHDKGYSHKRAVAAALNVARDKGYKVSQKMEKDYMNPSIREMKQKRGIRQNPSPKPKLKAEQDPAAKLDGPGKGGGCNNSMVNKGKK